MSDIPAARAELRAIADDLRTMRHHEEAARIFAVIARFMYRDDPTRPRLPLQERRLGSERRADA